ncbi:MAG: T9SS type A sorting domain-containing protein [Lewinellaceae bacterium]|nr:T9SS type A sorting domain-containing protein [Lewinellaceae bacterium]
MPRFSIIAGFLVSLGLFSAFRFPVNAGSYEPLPFNAEMLPQVPRHLPLFPMLQHLIPEADSVTRPHILMLDYSAYNANYAEKVSGYIKDYWPNADISEFWEGSPNTLRQLLSGKEMVVVPYPAQGDASVIHAYGAVLEDFVRKGGRVVLTGTHIHSTLHQYGLIDFDYGYFCKDLEIDEYDTGHPIFAGTPAHFTLANFAYPLDISDPAFVALAEVRGYPVVGFKPMGLGEVIYLGLEYYYDEVPSSLMLANVVRSTLNQSTTTKPITADPPIEREAAVTMPLDLYNIKVYPNPYVYKATVDIELRNSAIVSLEMTDESGRVVATPAPRRLLNPGFYQFELPNLPPGIYFLQYQLNEYNTVRKVVKIASP